MGFHGISWMDCAELDCIVLGFIQEDGGGKDRIGWEGMRL